MTTIHNGDCIEVMNAMPPESIDAIVTDPPYGLSFMQAKWDATPPGVQWAEACYRVLKPGGHIAAFGGTRTWHRLAVAIEDAGFEMRDSLAWLYGSGFPKSMNVGKAIDKAAGAERARVPYAGGIASGTANFGGGGTAHVGTKVSTAAITPEAEAWDGWGTALKPAFEPIVLARKPLAEKTVARNVLEHGTGAINVDACRIGTEPAFTDRKGTVSVGGILNTTDGTRITSGGAGRWPANVLLDQHTAEWVDEQSGVSESKASASRGKHGGVMRLDGFHTVDELRAAAEAGGKTPTGRDARATLARYEESPDPARGHTDSGGASRFFKVAEPDEPERPSGRWPANVLLDDHAAAWVDEQSGITTSPPVGSRTMTKPRKSGSMAGALNNPTEGMANGHGDSGGASRFFYTAKAPKRERPNVDGVQHPTVKPLAIMRWLIRLTTPPGGVVLDPFAGSGTTIEAALIEGFTPVGIEMETDYLPLIQHRIDRQENAHARLDA